MRRAASCFAAVALLLGAPAGLAANLSNVTNLSRSPGHGTQVEYMAEGGSSYLWYPGNINILKGQWKVEDGNIGFNYGPRSYNPVTKQRGGWECQPVRTYQSDIAEHVAGDPLGLARGGTVPFDLSGHAISLNQIIASVVNPGPPPIGGDFSCEGVIKNAERSKKDMAIAAGIYFGGIFMGKKCVEIDYPHALDLAARSEVGSVLKSYLDVLRRRAADGNRKAERALTQMGYPLTAQ